MPNLPPQLTQRAQSPMQGMPHMAQMMQGEGQIQEPEQESVKILAHFAPEELRYLDDMQGGILIDPETNLREYTPLDTALKDPQVREEVNGALSQNKQMFAEGGSVDQPGRPTDPELEKLRLQGTGEDTELAIITPELLEIFSEWARREPEINKQTGFPEFGFFKEVLRIAAPIVGAIFGGPVGAFAASTAANKVTGKSWGDSLKQGALSGGLAFGAGSLGLGGLGGGIGGSGGLGSMLGVSPGGMGGLFGSSGGGGLGGFLGGGAKSTPLSGVGNIIPGAATQASGSPAMQAAGQGGGGGFLGNILSNPLLPLVGSGLLMAKGHQDEKKNQINYKKQLEEQHQREKQETEGMRERLGYNAKLKPVQPFEYGEAPEATAEQKAKGIVPRFFNYSSGGAIKGIGKGQEDNIPKDVAENSYIIDASTVSDIGDGSTDAGFKELERYFSKVPSQQAHPINRKESNGGYIKAMVSDGEYEISPEKVTAIGGGSNEKGAKILKKFVQEIRAKKRNSGEKLPPKAKPISGYLNKITPSAA